MIYNDIGIQFLKAFGIIAIILTCGIVLAVIGIQHEHLTRLREHKKKLESEITEKDKKKKKLEKQLKSSEEDIKDLERELMLYERK